ncbi:hypothetical protein SAMN05892877_106309 [Rhizobium subbaraonis]|uniref:Uncharacterized protein n=1 Tax=Rhizobium subbaraonis TaxID=908946 RepID=A0A285UIB7_9HYPH|nr:hypothetical protein [Rhizobium subbaraonis]SOC39991.1 hypothetical protein SAMN05892877_106309 [Rhizobium subbaraonis]
MSDTRAAQRSILPGDLPQAPVAAASEVFHLIKQHGLMGTGIGYLDAHLLSSVKLSPNTALWTRAKRLANIALALDVGHAD